MSLLHRVVGFRNQLGSLRIGLGGMSRCLLRWFLLSRSRFRSFWDDHCLAGVCHPVADYLVQVFKSSRLTQSRGAQSTDLAKRARRNIRQWRIRHLLLANTDRSLLIDMRDFTLCLSVSHHHILAVGRLRTDHPPTQGFRQLFSVQRIYWSGCGKSLAALHKIIHNLIMFLSLLLLSHLKNIVGLHHLIVSLFKLIGFSTKECSELSLGALNYWSLDETLGMCLAL